MSEAPKRWSVERAQAWAAEVGFLAGCNYTPASASNQLELWQEATFDPERIERELGWSRELGFDTLRIYLHDLLWEPPVRGGFVERVRRVFDLAHATGHRVIPVLFDDCWAPEGALGPQPEPVPGVHNSRWLKSPSKSVLMRMDQRDRERLEAYTRGVMGALADHPAVVLWDVHNEPGNAIKADEGRAASLRLLKLAFGWARAAGVPQPLTSGVMARRFDQEEIMLFQAAASDVLSFHHYAHADELDDAIRFARGERDGGAVVLGNEGRPMVCTEYMIRTRPGNAFADVLPKLRARGIGAIHWGLVDGRTQTKWPWSSWKRLGVPAGEAAPDQDPGEVPPEPDPWHHEVLRADGTPYREEEAALIRRVLGAAGDA